MEYLDIWEYRRRSPNRALASALTVLRFEIPRFVMLQNGLLDPQFDTAVARAFREGRVSGDDCNELFKADVVVSDQDNRHAVVVVSIAADTDDIRNAKEQAHILAEVTGGTVTAVVITTMLDSPQDAQADQEGVEVLIIPYP